MIGNGRLLAMLAEAAENGNEKPRIARKQPEMQARIVSDCHQYLCETFEKKEGLLIVPKKGFWHGYKIPDDSVCVITIVFDETFAGDKDHGSPHFHRKRDIAILYLDEGEDLVEVAVDSRFFEPYKGGIE